MRVLVALLLMWLLAATLCGGRKSWPLAYCAPLAILMCWVIWYQIQGWPLTSRPDLGLALFAGITILGFLSGKLLQGYLRAPDVIRKKATRGMRTGTRLFSSLTSEHYAPETRAAGLTDGLLKGNLVYTSKPTIQIKFPKNAASEQEPSFHMQSCCAKSL
jgi:hypothetical protein